jgi:hypothetical protein
VLKRLPEFIEIPPADAEATGPSGLHTGPARTHRFGPEAEAATPVN